MIYYYFCSCSLNLFGPRYCTAIIWKGMQVCTIINITCVPILYNVSLQVGNISVHIVVAVIRSTWYTFHIVRLHCYYIIRSNHMYVVGLQVSFYDNATCIKTRKGRTCYVLVWFCFNQYK